MANSSPRFSEEAENAISVLRALVSSKKGQSTVQGILSDYRELEGGPLMYKKYGFPNADEFLKASGEFIVQGRMGEPSVVYVKPSKDSAHIMRMVAAQKTTKTKKSGFAVMRQPQMRNGNYKWNPSAYNQMYKQMPYQANRYPAQKSNQQQYFYKQYQPQQQSQQQKYNNPLKAFFQGAPGRYNSVNNRTQANTTNNNIQPKPLMAVKIAPPGHNTQFQNQQIYQQRTNLHEPNNNNNSSVAKNLNKILQSPVKSTPAAVLASNDLRHKLNEKAPSQQQQQNSLNRQDEFLQVIGQPRNDFSDTAYDCPAGKAGVSEFSNNDAAPVLLLSPPRSVNSRLQITKNVIPTAEPMQPSLYNLSLVGSSRQDPGRTPKSIIAPPHVPVVELPTLPGKKTLQDRLKSNQKVDSVDLEKISKVITPQSPPSGASEYNSKSQFNTPVSQSSGANREREPFSWNEPHATPVEMLFQYAQYNGHTRPIYKYFKLKNKRIQCRVTVNGSTYSTYPDDYTNEFEGQFAAAQIAIANIRRDEERSNYSVCLDSEFEIATKIHQLLVKCSHGMFSKNIPDAFRREHHALLPDNWELIILAHSRMFSQEDVERNTIVFANIEDQSNSDEMIPDVPEVTSGAKLMSANLLALPWKEQYWNVYVTNPVSTVEIWARLVGPEYSDEMDALITDIELSMMDNGNSTRPVTVSVGEYYLVSTTDCWYRVRVEEIDALNNACVCFFIDTGDWERVTLNDVYTCDPRYLKLPGQSLCFSLDGLEDFGENPKAKRHLDNLISGKVCIGEIITSKDEYEKEGESAFSEARIRLILYDTSSDEDVHLNSILLKHICDDTPVPELNRKSVTTVIITHIDDDGNVYCQLKDTAMVYIQKLINNLIQSNALKGKQRGLYKAKAVGEHLLYLVQDEHDKKWYRASLENEESGPFCKMLYVDMGIKKSVNVSNIYRLETLSVALSRYPPQAIRTKMFDIPEINDYLLSRLRALLKPGLTAMVKVAAFSVLPLVKVYMHLDQNNILVCVNDSIRSEMELEIVSEVISEPRIYSDGHSNSCSTVSSASGLNNEQRKLGSPVPSQVIPKLPRFPLPGVGDLFDISVTIASSPNYFIVQPYSYAQALNRMMEDLQKYCMSQAQPIPMDRVQQGEVYAGLNNDDGHWYRVLVVNILCGPTLIHVYFCDYGKIRILDSDMLRILPQELRTLPQQAVKAKLHGVQPTHGDWNTEDAVRFQQLTVDKKFASYIRSIQADEFNQNEEIVELELIDVSTDEDVLVHRILVDEKRAVLTSK